MRQHADQRQCRADQEMHEPGIAVRAPVEAAVEAVGQALGPAGQEEARLVSVDGAA